MNRRPGYSKEVRECAVRLVLTHEPDLGGNPINSIQNWLHARDFAVMEQEDRS